VRVGISGIAWDIVEDALVADLLRRYEIDAIDIVPGKYFPRPMDVSAEEISAVGRWWRAHGVEITGMQALLFGTTGLNLFGTAESRTAMQDHLAAICRIGGALGARRLVFGSPKNRDRTGLTDNEAQLRAVDFFRRIGDIASAAGVEVCLEPNPERYGANFMTTSLETADVVRAINHPAIRMQLDTGAMTINEEDPEEVVQQCADLIGHIHASEPDLVPLGDGGARHDAFANVISMYLPRSTVSIEMVATREESHLGSMERAIRVARAHYGSASPLADVGATRGTCQ